MKRVLLFGAVAVVLLGLQGAASADWFDDFDLYNLGPIVNQSSWEEWAAGCDADVSDKFCQSDYQSVEILPNSDLVHQYFDYDEGRWSYIAWQFLPRFYTGNSHFIMLNTYAFPCGPYFWSVQLDFDSASGKLVGDCGAADNVKIPYVTKEWKKIQVNVDLDEDWVQVYYDGTLLDDPIITDHPVYGGGYVWSEGVFGAGGGTTDIAAVDLFGNSATEVYYDDMRLVPTGLIPDVYEIDSSVQSYVNFDLDASPYHAGDNYFLLGSVTGISPGTPLPGGGHLPLNWDTFTGITLKLGMAGVMQGFMGVLDADGRGQAQLNTYGPLPPQAVGLVMFFAYTTYAPFNYQSNPVAIEVI